MANENHGLWWDPPSWNPATGCSPVSPGCDNCWAAGMAKRFDGGDFSVKFHVERLGVPLRWRKPRRVFVCSTGDLFHKDVPNRDIQSVFNVIMRCHHEKKGHDFFILTKRPERMRDLLSGQCFLGLMPPNLHLGVSIENQAVDERIPILLQTPAAKRFISVEPMLERINLKKYLAKRGINFIIFGCESGPHRRPISWADMIYSVNQCREAGVPVWVKQIGSNEDGTGKVIKDLDLFPPELRYRAIDAEHELIELEMTGQ